MAENETGLSGGTFDPNRPRLKKVKRPIKRIIPQGSTTPAAPKVDEEMLINRPQANMPHEDRAFDLDAYLDEDNLPAVAPETPQVYDNRQPHFISEEELQPAPEAASWPFLSKKAFIIAMVVVFFTGFFAAKLLSGGQKVIRDGLQGVVINSEIPRGRARCGVAEKTQGCVLYLMNPQRQELNARDFYDLASQLTGRQRFMIETGNMRYSNVKIRPGEIGQFNIPPLQ